MTYPDWWDLIDKQAALREQFPPLRTLRRERPGTATDKTRTAQYQAENQAAQHAHEQRLWEQSIDHNTTLQARRDRRTRNNEYNAHKRRKQAS